MAYDDLEIQDGMEASREYLNAILEPDAEEKERRFSALLKYCEGDTEAMVELRRALGELG